jgi:hypothetical protein
MAFASRISAIAEIELARLEGDANFAAAGESPEKDFVSKHITDFALDQAAERTGTKDRIISATGQITPGTVGQG